MDFFQWIPLEETIEISIASNPSGAVEDIMVILPLEEEAVEVITAEVVEVASDKGLTSLHQYLELPVR